MEKITNNSLEALGMTGVKFGNPVLIEGVLGTGLYFNTSYQYVKYDNDKIECPLDPGLCQEGFTISAWLKIPSSNPTGVPNILLVGFLENVVGVRWRMKPAGYLILYSIVKGATNRTKIKITSFPRDIWFHLATVYDAHLNPTIYLDGVLKNDVSITLEEVDVKENLFKDYFISVGYNQAAEGGIWVDEIYIWQRYLKSSEVVKVFGGI